MSRMLEMWRKGGSIAAEDSSISRKMAWKRSGMLSMRVIVVRMLEMSGEAAEDSSACRKMGGNGGIGLRLWASEGE